jgi:hypothetical protein
MMRSPRPGLRYALALLAALAFSLLYLQVCSQVGRLSHDLQYDDVGYAVDAATHLDAGLSGGIPELVRSYGTLRPHSWLSSFQGLVALALGGVHDLSLYASNAWLLVALALLLVLALRERPAAATAVAIAFALSSPLAYFAIAEFRPDIALGFTTALMTWFLLEAGFGENRRALRWAAIMLAASLVVKSTFFAHTLALAIGLCVTAALATRAQRFGWMPRFVLRAREIAAFLGLGVALALPFFLFTGHVILDYFWSNTLGSKAHIWNFGAETPLHEVFAGFRPLMFGLGRHQTQAAALAAVVFAALLWRRGDRAATARIFGLLATGAVSAAIIVLGRQPSHFFFATLHWLVLFAAIYGYVRFQDRLADRGRRTLAIAAAATIAGLAVVNSAYTSFPLLPGTEHGGSVNERLVQAIAADTRDTRLGSSSTAYVLVLSASAANPHTLMWVGRLAGQRIRSIETAFMGDPAEAEKLAAWHDYVVVPNRARVNDGRFPIARVQAPMLDWMQSDRRFEPLLPVEASQAYYLFANRENTARFHAQELFEAPGAFVSFEHFRAEEGPYPQLSPPLPRLRWIEGREATACMALAPAEPVDVAIRFFARMPGTLTLDLDGQALARASLAEQRFGEIHARIVPRTGRTCLRMSIDAPPTEPPLYVMVTHFRVAAAAR